MPKERAIFLLLSAWWWEPPFIALEPCGAILQSAGNTYFVSYRFEPDEPEMNRDFDIVVSIHLDEARTQAAMGTALQVDARMPQHRHGMNVRPRIRELEPGNYRVEGLRCHMPGRWELYFDITRDGLTERAACVLSFD